MAHEQAVLIHFAVVNPKKMPKYKPAKAETALSNDAQVDLVRAWFLSKVSECPVQ